jgi:transposase
MPRNLDPIVVERLHDDLRELGSNLSIDYIKQLASNYDCTVGTIYWHKARVEAGIPRQRASGGPRRVITWPMEQAIKHLLDQRPWYYQDEIAVFLHDAFDVEVHRSTISRALRRIQITRKRLKVIASQQNDELRTEWLEQLQYFTADQIVSIDESGSDDRVGDRYYGWSTKGVCAIVRRWFGNKLRVSMLAAYTIDGYIKALVFDGTCDRDIFEGFIIDQVAPLCNPYPNPRSVIILDNALVHHKNRQNIEEVCRRHGVLVRFLPPYSPDFNLIEESFIDLKAWIRRYYHRERRKYETYHGFLAWAIQAVGTGSAAARRARAHFRNAGIPGVPED